MTVATVLVAVGSLLQALSRERSARKQHRADTIRSAASETLAKLERLQELSLFFYSDIQPLFVKVGSKLTADDVDVTAARDMMYEALTEAHAKAKTRVMEENLQLAYVKLQIYDTRVYASIAATVDRLRRLDGEAFSRFLEDSSQDAILNLDPREEDAPAILGNALRSAAGAERKSLQAAMTEALEPTRSFLLRVIALDDDELLASGRKLEVAGAPS